MPLIKEARANGELLRAHAFELACAKADIDHRTIKDATVKRYHWDDHAQLERTLKTLKGLTPYAFISKRWIIEPERFRSNPLRQMPGLNI